MFLSDSDKVDISHFEVIKVLGTGAYGKVYLVRKKGGSDKGQLYAMKVLNKATVVQKKKTAEHTKTERQVLEAIRSCPFLVRMYYAFQTDAKLYLILGECDCKVASSNDCTVLINCPLCIADYVSGGELFTHLYQRDYFTERDVQIYIAEVVLALERLHSVSVLIFGDWLTAAFSCSVYLYSWASSTEISNWRIFYSMPMGTL